jgi:Tol biopolymer transport system component
MHKYLTARWREMTLGLVICAITLVFPVEATAQESVRAELTRLQKQNGISLVSQRDNKVYTIDFAKRSLRESKPLPGSGTANSGYFSEDGTKLAVALCREPGITHPTPYTTECPRGVVLAIMQADGSDRHEYTDLANPDYMTCWSHDGSKIALVMQDRREGRYPGQLQILNLATGTTQVIAGKHYPFVDPQCWSPDDKHVVYTSSNMAGQGLVSIYDVDLNKSRDFSKGTRPTWSPDGEWIALMDCPPSLRCKYYLVSPSGNKKRLLFKSEAATSLWWSPDSRFVAYVNGARFFERTPHQLLREMVRLRVRRLEDGSDESFADFFDGDTMEFQWVPATTIKRALPTH